MGPLLALIPASLIGGAALLLLHGNTSTIRGVVGFAAAVFAAPGLLVAGVPLTAGTTVYAAAVGGSAVVWFALGALAARRATSRAVCSWRDFWREFAWLACGVWLGVIGALLAANLVMGRALF